MFAVLPTDYGNSLCYGCLSLVFDILHHPTKPYIVCVITPLTAIIQDQVSSFIYSQSNANALFLTSTKVTLDFGPVSAPQAMHKTAAIKKKYSRAIVLVCCILTTHHCTCLNLTAVSEPAKSYPHSRGTGLLC